MTEVEKAIEAINNADLYTNECEGCCPTQHDVINANLATIQTALTTLTDENTVLSALVDQRSSTLDSLHKVAHDAVSGVLTDKQLYCNYAEDSKISVFTIVKLLVMQITALNHEVAVRDRALRNKITFKGMTTCHFNDIYYKAIAQAEEETGNDSNS